MATSGATNHHTRNGQQPEDRGDWDNDLAQILAAIEGSPTAGQPRPSRPATRSGGPGPSTAQATPSEVPGTGG